MAYGQLEGCPALVLPGRVRVRVPGLLQNPWLARRLNRLLGALPGVRQAVANPDSGNLLVVFDPAMVTPAMVARMIGLRSETPAAAALPDVRRHARQVILTGAALAAVAVKRHVLGPSLLATTWGTYDLAGIVTVVASYPFLRRGLQDALTRRRLSSDAIIGAAGLGAALVRENILGLAALFLSSLSHLLLARTVRSCRHSVAQLLTRMGEPAGTEASPGRTCCARHGTRLAERVRTAATQLGAWAMGGAALTGLLTGDWRRALAVLVAAAPGAQSLGGTMPLHAATAAAARRGVLVKGPEAIAAAGHVDAVVLGGDRDGHVARLQSAGQVVAVAGAGHADVPGLLAADLAVALGPGAEGAAIRAADAVVLAGGRSRLGEFLTLGRRTVRTIHQNRAVAGVLNAAGLALAALGVIGPLGASVWHNLTSLAVLINAMRLLPR